MTKLGYLFPAFPVFHQTFVLWEVLGLKRHGVQPLIYSMWPGTERQQPEGAAIAKTVAYLPAMASAEALAATAGLLVRSPRRFFGLIAAVVSAWRTGAEAPQQESTAARSRATLYNRLRGWLNGHPFPYLIKSLALIPTAIHLNERLQKDGITHLHVHWATYPATVAFLVNRLSGLPFSISAHAYDIYMTQRMLPAKIAAAEFVVTCAKTNQRFLSKLVAAPLQAKIHVNYHGVDISRFTPVSQEGKLSDRLVIGSCGQLERYKGMHLLVEACARLRREGVDVSCWIVGEGVERVNLERQIGELGLQDHIRLLGGRPHKELVEMLAMSDAFVLASELAGRSRRRDVIANVIVEAMAMGLPVIASRIPGAEELVDDSQCGFLVEPNAVEPIVDAVRRLAQSREERQRLGRAARRRILAEFDGDANVQRLIQMLVPEWTVASERLAAVGGRA